MDTAFPMQTMTDVLSFLTSTALLEENQNHVVPSTVLMSSRQSASLPKGTEYTLERVQNEHSSNKAAMPGVNELAVCGVHTIGVMFTEV